MRWKLSGALVLIIAAAQPLTYAAGLYVYPAKGQSSEQQSADEGACYNYARNQTGVDPMAMQAPTAPPPEEGHQVLGGAFKGALLGTAVGAIAGDTGQGAAIGAVSGGFFGGMKKRNSRQQEEQLAQQQSQQYAADSSAYDRAYSACLEGRGYTVK